MRIELELTEKQLNILKSLVDSERYEVSKKINTLIFKRDNSIKEYSFDKYDKQLEIIREHSLDLVIIKEQLVT